MSRPGKSRNWENRKLKCSAGLFCFLLSVFCFQFFSSSALAHAPFDNSSALIVRDDTLELAVTMGMDGSQQFLSNAGLSEADATTALTVRGPSTVTPLSANLAPKFFEVAMSGKLLVARSVTVMTDGLEANFTITYPRPAAGDLALRALYFNGIEAMKPGTFMAMDENRNGLGAAKLTHAQPTVEIKLPAAATVMAAVVETPKQAPPTSTTTNPAAVTATTPAPSAGRFPLLLFPTLLLAAAVLWFVSRKRTKRE